MTDNILEELFKDTVIKFKNNDCVLPALYPSSSIRSYTKESRKRFFENHDIKIIQYGDSGGGNYTFFLFRDDDNCIYDIYIAWDKCHILHVYDENYSIDYEYNNI
jgi:hypothetical protein